MTRRQDAPPPVDPATGLTPGQSWAIAPGPTWQARLDRAGRAHVVGRALAEHAEHGPGYLDHGAPRASRRVVVRDIWEGGVYTGAVTDSYLRPWHSFERARRAASYHERLWLTAKRNEAQAGQGGDA